MTVPTTLPSSVPRFRLGNILDQIQMPHHWPAQGDVLSFCYKMGPGEAAIFVILGVIFVLFGINIFKFLVMANAGIAGAAIGAFAGDKAGNAGVGAMIGGFTAAVLAWPLMKHAVALMGGVIGAVVGASLWRVFGLNHEFFWAGAMCGGITFGMLSFLLFRGCVMMYTSLQGSLMIVVGILSLICKYQDAAPRMMQTMSAKTYIMPIAIFIPFLCGLIFQQSPAPGAAGAAAPKKK